MLHRLTTFGLNRVGAALVLSVLATACVGDAGLAQARYYHSKGQPIEAIRALESAVGHDPANRGVLRMLGELYLEQGDLLLAEQALRRALLLGDDTGQLRLLLGRTLLRQGQYARVLQEIGPASQASLRPAILSLRGNAALELGDLDAARDMFDEALDADPESTDALLGLARIALRDRQIVRALHLIAHALEVQPANPELLRFRDDISQEGEDIAHPPINYARR